MMWITFVILIVIVFFAAGKYFKKDATNILSGESALDILKKRLASGEITEEEYSKLKKELEK